MNFITLVTTFLYKFKLLETRCHRQTDRRTDRQTDMTTYRAAIAAKKQTKCRPT